MQEATGELKRWQAAKVRNVPISATTICAAQTPTSARAFQEPAHLRETSVGGDFRSAVRLVLPRTGLVLCGPRRTHAEARSTPDSRHTSGHPGNLAHASHSEADGGQVTLATSIRTAIALSAAPVEAVFERGVKALQNRDFALAESCFRQVIATQPKSAGAHKLLGMTFTAQERTESAEPEFQQACALNPKEENACYYLGKTLYLLSRLPEAKRAFDLALRHTAARGPAPERPGAAV